MMLSRRRLTKVPAALLLVCLCWSGSAPNTESGDDPLPRFPTIDLLPKQVTGALEFLAEHPDADGRGITVAIFDTGVDPGAPGLQVTSDGRPKIVDIVDTTGSGDVPMTVEQKAKEGTLDGLTGRKLMINPDWKNPQGEFRLGIVRAYDLFPEELIARLNAERLRDWDRRQDARAADLRQHIKTWDAEHPKPTAIKLHERTELQSRLEVLDQARQNFDDPGPMYDCVTFFDGEQWRAVVDTDEDGDLADETVLTDFHIDRKYGTFSPESQLNFSVNVYDEGRLLSIVTLTGDHGTHVAGIVGACYPNEPERNGIAPGVQIVSVKIGDTRLAGMETGRGLVRGLRTVLDRHCDLINMSYGEPASLPNAGRLSELFSEVVREHGVIFIASAGNEGPALSTVGAPGGTTEALMGIGAYLTPEMMSAAYAMRSPYEGLPYTWTSRGPASDGALGVSLFAPGGAVAPVPRYNLQPSLLMNGTSMASPNACGNVALLLSALKAADKTWTPSGIRRALENSARLLPGIDTLTQGHGLVQIGRAHDWMTDGTLSVAERLEYRIEIGAERERGIYLREPDQQKEPLVTRVNIKPRFREHAPKDELVDFEVPLTLQASALWIHVGDHLLLSAALNYFEVEVDPRGLPPGLHAAEIRIFEDGTTDRGPLVQIPVTVIRPHADGAANFSQELALTPGQVTRHFLVPPDGATWMDVHVTLHEADGERRFILQTVQMREGSSFEAGEMLEFVSLEPEGESTHSTPVVPGRTVEVCLAQYWSSLGNSRVSLNLEFRGLEPDDDEIMLPSDGSPATVTLTSHIRREHLAPTGSLKVHRQVLVPETANIDALTSSRDRLPDGGPTHRLVLTYKLTQPEDGETTIRVPRFDGLLYDSPLEGQEWMIFDANNRRLRTDDLFPERFSLDKGEYTVRLEMRSADAAWLKTLRGTALAVDRELSSPMKLSMYGNAVEAAQGRGRFSPRWLDPGESATVWMATPADTKWPAGVNAGDVLLGEAQFVNNPEGGRGADVRPAGFLVSLTVPAAPPADDAAPKPAEKQQPLAERLAKARLDFELSQLSMLKWPADQELLEALQADILREHPDARRQVLVARLKMLDDDDREERLPEIIAATDEILETIDQSALAARLAFNVDSDDPEAQRRRTEDEELKATLVDVLYRKGRALGYMELPEVVEKHPIADPEAHDKKFVEVFRDLARWVDTTEKDYVLLHIRRDRRQERYGTALKQLNTLLDETSPPREMLDKKRRDLYESLGWDDWSDYEQQWMRIRFPKSDVPF